LVSSRQLFIQSDDPDQVRQQISTDFEDGSTAPWYNFMYPNDASNGKALFELEDFNSPLQGNSPAPKPESGTKYLRAVREIVPLQGVYRIAFKSETFLAMPGDEISLKVWLRFRKSTSNSLGVILSLITVLFHYYYGNINIVILFITAVLGYWHRSGSLSRLC